MVHSIHTLTTFNKLLSEISLAKICKKKNYFSNSRLIFRSIFYLFLFIFYHKIALLFVFLLMYDTN